MTPLIRIQSRILTGALLAVVAACVNTQPLTAQSASPPTARDSLHAKAAKAKADTVALALAKYCKTKGAASYVCATRAVLARSQAAESSLVAFSAPPAPQPIPTPTPTPVPPPPPPVDTTHAATDAELPRVYLTTTVASTPMAGRSLKVAIGGNLQAAIDTARDGDRILLACGGVYTGNTVLRHRAAGGVAGQWAGLQPDCVFNLADSELVRINPAKAAALRLPILKSLSSGPALSTDLFAVRWRVTLIEVTNDLTAANNTWGLVALGDAGDFQKTLDQVASDLVLDRVYIHATDALDIRRGVAWNCGRCALVNSYVSGIHSTFDAQAVAGWNGPGPFKIVNNYLEASQSGIASGGANTAIAGLIPSDWEIRGNHITSNLAWKGTWVLKTLIEMKMGVRVLIDGNVLENTMPDGQNGYAFVFWAVNQSGATPWAMTRDITIRNNVIRNVNAGFNLAANGYDHPVAQDMNHVTIRNNVGLYVNNPAVNNSMGRLFQIGGNINQLTIEHNTIFSQSNSSFIWNTNLLPLTDHIVRDNLVGGGQYQIFNGNNGSAAWAIEAGPGSVFLGNAVVGYPGWYLAIPNNSYPDTFDGVGFVGGAAAVTSATATIDDLALAATSALKGTASDGCDPGASIAAIKIATAGAVGPGELGITTPPAAQRVTVARIPRQIIPAKPTGFIAPKVAKVRRTAARCS